MGEENEEYFVVRISKEKNSLYLYNQVLQKQGFEFNERSFGNSYYEKRMSAEDAEQIRKWGSREKLRIDVIPERYTRSTDYRKTFFSNNRPAVEARYRCAYCGRKFLYKDTTVDHIFPVNQLSYSPKVRRRAAWCGIYGANEEKNLVAACRKCNSRKGTKMGMWIIRGFIGKHEGIWKLRIALRWTVGALLATYAVGTFLYGAGINAEHILVLLGIFFRT